VTDGEQNMGLMTVMDLAKVSGIQILDDAIEGPVERGEDELLINC